MESNSVCNHTRVNKLNQTTAQRESDLFTTRMITDRIGRNKVLLPINYKNYNFREEKSQVMKDRKICIKRRKLFDVVIA